MHKDELLANVHTERAALDSLASSLDDAALTAPALDNGHSVKDILAHISLWERLCARWIDAAARGQTPDRPEVADVNATNARDHAASKDIPLDRVLAESSVTHQAVLDAVEALSEADLADDQRFGFPAWQLVRANSDEHYREHIDQIAAWRRGVSG
jgi:hypothetical protein